MGCGRNFYLTYSPWESNKPWPHKGRARRQSWFCDCHKLQGCRGTVRRRKLCWILGRMVPFLFTEKKKYTQQNSGRQWVRSSLLLFAKPLLRPECSGPQPEKRCSFLTSWAICLASHCLCEKKNLDPGRSRPDPQRGIQKTGTSTLALTWGALVPASAEDASYLLGLHGAWDDLPFVKTRLDSQKAILMWSYICYWDSVPKRVRGAWGRVFYGLPWIFVSCPDTNNWLFSLVLPGASDGLLVAFRINSKILSVATGTSYPASAPILECYSGSKELLTVLGAHLKIPVPRDISVQQPPLPRSLLQSLISATQMSINRPLLSRHLLPVRIGLCGSSSVRLPSSQTVRSLKERTWTKSPFCPLDQEYPGGDKCFPIWNEKSTTMENIRT